jgi:hypothetical protein
MVARGLACVAPWSAARDEDVPDPARGDVRFVVFGDVNGPYGSVTYPAPVAAGAGADHRRLAPRRRAPARRPRGRPGPLPPDERFEAMWEAFDADVAAPLRAAGIPYVAAMGNHDASNLRDRGAFAFARERDAAAAYWARPEHRAGLDVVDRRRCAVHVRDRLGPLFVATIDASGPVVDADQRAALARRSHRRPPARRARGS